MRVLAETLKQPLKTLLKLSGVEYVKETTGWEGINVVTGEYEDLMEAGVVDSLLVAKNCVIDSVAAASMLLSLELAVVKETKYQESEYRMYKGKFEM